MGHAVGPKCSGLNRVEACGSTTSRMGVVPQSRKARKQDRLERPPLEPSQFPELNGMFYNADPAGYLRMRIESVSLMLCTDDVLRPAFSSARSIRSTFFGAMEPPSDESRRRFVVTESNLIFHHAAETLLRMFYAHLEQEDCPWLGIASSVDFTEFKRKLDRDLKAGFDRDNIAQIFLGGVSAADAQIHLADDEFDDGVDAVALLLRYAAERYLSESFVYNAAKHGLSSVMVDNATMEFESESSGRIRLHNGDLQTYLHKNRLPGVKNEPVQWFVSATGTLPDQDLAVSLLIQRAIESLWNVARRRYLAQQGQILVLTTNEVELCIYGPVQGSLNVVRTFIYELPKRLPDGSIRATNVNFVNQTVPHGWAPSEENNTTREVKRVNLLVRQRDQRAQSTSRRYLLPFSPDGMQQV